MARRKVDWSTTAAILILWGFSGCAGIGKPLESPRISLSNIQAQKSTGFETIFLVQLRVMNPNEVELDIRGVDCEVEVNGQPFAYGISNTAVTVPAYGSETVPVTVYSSVIDIARSIFKWQGRDELSYRLKGKVKVEGAAWMPPALRFDSQGTVSFRELAGGLKEPS